MLQMIRDTAKTVKPGKWISMMGYEPTLFPEKRHPTIEELDEAAPDNPVHCMHGGGHICMYNHKALEYLGVYGPEDAAKYPEDEVEVIDGKLTGMVRGHTHFWLWGQVDYSEEQQRKAALKWASATVPPTTPCRSSAATVSSVSAPIWRCTVFSANPSLWRTMTTG